MKQIEKGMPAPPSATHFDEFFFANGEAVDSAKEADAVRVEWYDGDGERVGEEVLSL